MKMLQIVAPVLLALVALMLPDYVLAAGEKILQIIPTACYCPNQAPGWGCVLQTIQNGMNLAIVIGVIIATLVIAYAGALWILSPVNPKNKELGRTMLFDAVIGLVIVLAAWILVDSLMKVVYNPSAGGFGPWQTILSKDANSETQCISPTPRGNATDGTTGGTDGTDGTDGTGGDGDGTDGTGGTDGNGTQTPNGSPEGCVNCVKVQGVAHKTPDQVGCDVTGGNDGVKTFNPALDYCYVNSSLLSKLQASVGNSSGWRVTEMWPPTTNHSASCHANGSCVDVAKTSGSASVPDIAAMANAMKAQGLYVVYETSSLSAAQCQQVLDLVPNNNDKVKLLKLSTSPHFSVYTTEHQRDGSGCIGF